MTQMPLRDVDVVTVEDGIVKEDEHELIFANSGEEFLIYYQEQLELLHLVLQVRLALQAHLARLFES